MTGRWSGRQPETSHDRPRLDRIVRHFRHLEADRRIGQGGQSPTNKSFADTLSKVETTIGLKPKTGFTAGPTYEANTLTGQTKAALNNAVNTVKSALHIPQ